MNDSDSGRDTVFVSVHLSHIRCRNIMCKTISSKQGDSQRKEENVIGPVYKRACEDWDEAMVKKTERKQIGK